MSNEATRLPDVVMASLWNARHVHPFWATAIDGVGRALRVLHPLVRIYHHGPGEESGCTWKVYVNASGQAVELFPNPWPSDAAHLWEISLSYRGPLITASSWSDPDRGPDAATDLKLVRFVMDVATQLGLVYVDAHSLRNCVVPWEGPDDLPTEAMNRLDWSTEANAFNLLFYEE